MDVETLMRELSLEPLPVEGGWFRETYRSSHRHATVGGDRSRSTAIYYLLTDETFSAFHRLIETEVYHFYLGDPIELSILPEAPGGALQTHIVGSDLLAGQRPQCVVPGGSWHGSRLLPGGHFALLGTTMALGFDVADFEIGDRSALTARYPEAAERIRALTRR